MKIELTEIQVLLVNNMIENEIEVLKTRVYLNPELLKLKELLTPISVK